MRRILAVVIPLLLAGCATLERQGCSGSESCARPLSSPEHLVIWWAPDMRGGLAEGQVTTRYRYGD
jgi:hypothetical protein